MQQDVEGHCHDLTPKLLHCSSHLLALSTGLKCILGTWHVSTPLALAFMGGFHREQETQQGKAPWRKGGGGKGCGCATLSATQ